MINYCFNIIALGFVFYCAFYSHKTLAQTDQLTLQIPPAQLVLSTSSAPLLRRESQFLPHEFEVIQNLKPLLEAGDYQQALALLNARERKFSAKPMSPALRIVRAQLATQQKDFALAQQDLDTALAELPDFVRGHQAAAMLHLATEQWGKAQASISKAVSLGGGDAELYGQLGYLHLRKHNAWAASAAYQQALMLTPTNRYYRDGLLSALLLSKQFRSAQSLVEDMLLDAPSKASLWLRRANIALETNDHNTALSSIEAAIRLGDTNAENHRVAAQLHMQKGNYQRATQLLENAITTETWNTHHIDGALAWLEREQQWQHIARLLDKIQPQLTTMSAEPLSQYHLYRGKLALAKDQLNKASTAYKAAMTADPSNGEALIAAAEIFIAKKSYTQAELLYTRAQAIDSVREQALLGQAQLFIDRRDYPAALELLRTAYHDYPKNHGLEKNIQTLAHIIKVQKQ